MRRPCADRGENHDPADARHTRGLQNRLTQRPRLENRDTTKSLDVSFRSLSDFALHRTANSSGEAASILSRMLAPASAQVKYGFGLVTPKEATPDFYGLIVNSRVR
jgi:hypothetical protein